MSPESQCHALQWGLIPSQLLLAHMKRMTLLPPEHWKDVNQKHCVRPQKHVVALTWLLHGPMPVVPIAMCQDFINYLGNPIQIWQNHLLIVEPAAALKIITSACQISHVV